MPGSRIAAAFLLLLPLFAEVPARAAVAPSSPPLVEPSRLALATPDAESRLAFAAESAIESPAATKPRGSDVWRSAVVPGWGQWRAGYRELGLAFAAIDVAAWTTLAASVGQGHLRRGSSEETALRFAGIDLTQVDDTFRKRVSDFISSEEYNRLVVMRDAAALYYGDFDDYNRYIDEHALTGDEGWTWESDESFERYRRERRASERAFQRARFAAAVLLANRVASAVVASRLHPKTEPPAAPSSAPRAQLLWGLGASPQGGLEPRLSCVVRF